GMAKPGPLAIGGAKLKARASADANRRYAYLRDEYEEAARASSPSSTGGCMQPRGCSIPAGWYVTRK
ncbi:MAG: hypothetical protein SWK76_14035, partial [Actinomycetota bacterium]|nr:hypothetical protein [Actinomycetota bacterium]